MAAMPVIGIIQLGLQLVQIWQQERMVRLNTQWQNRDIGIKAAHLELAQTEAEKKAFAEEKKRLEDEITFFLQDQKALLEEKRYKEAADRAQTAITLLFKKEPAIEGNPTREIAKLQWINFTAYQGMALFLSRDYEAARSVLLRIDSVSGLPSHSTIKLFLGLSCERLGDTARALSALKSAAELHPYEDLIQIAYQYVKGDNEQVLLISQRNPALLRTEPLVSLFCHRASTGLKPPVDSALIGFIPAVQSSVEFHRQNKELSQLFASLPDSRFPLGRTAQAFMTGEKLEVDPSKANELFRISFIEMANTRFGKKITSEEDPALLESERFLIYQDLADLTPGYRKAMRYMGLSYQSGSHARASTERAKYYFQKLYNEGQGTKDRDVELSILNLAKLLDDGTHTNASQAKALYAQAKRWDPEAAWREADLVYQGRGLPKDWTTAKALYEVILSEPGDRFTPEQKNEAWYRIGHIQQSQDHSDFKGSLLKAAKAGHMRAAYQYALVCEASFSEKIDQSNLEGHDDLTEALRYFKLVADASSTRSCSSDQGKAAFKYAELRRQFYSVSLLYKDAFRELNRDQTPKAFEIKRQVVTYYELAHRLGVKEAPDRLSAFHRSAIAMNIAASPAGLASSIVEVGKSCSIQ